MHDKFSTILSFQCNSLLPTVPIIPLVDPGHGSAVDTGPGSAATKIQDNASLACM